MLHNILEALLLWMEQMGYWGIMIGLMIEVIPSEIVLAYGGYLVSRGSISFLGAVIFGTIGGTIAQIFIYWIGKYGGRPFLEKYGKYLLINKHHIDVSEQWFNRYGAGVIFTARFIPVVRHAISIPAGIARMPLMKFTLLTVAAIIPWSILFVWLGAALGEQWGSIHTVAGPYIKEAMYIAIGLLALYFLFAWFRSRRKRAHAAVRHTDNIEKTDALLKLGREYVVFSGLKLHMSDDVPEIDGLAVGPNGLFFYDKITNLRTSGKDPTLPLYRNEYALKELLRSVGVETDLVGLLVLSGPEEPLANKDSAFVAVKEDQLPQYIKSYQGKRRLQPQTVQQIASIIRGRMERR
jgi:membrane protein DedA with SNARE-associated domain